MKYLKDEDIIQLNDEVENPPISPGWTKICEEQVLAGSEGMKIFRFCFAWIGKTFKEWRESDVGEGRRIRRSP